MSYPTLFSASATSFTSQGLGVLVDCISCSVPEERNGRYELEMQYPISGAHFAEIEQRGIVLAKPNYTDDPQPFRIYKISKPLNGICTIYAQHISYDLSGYEVPAGSTASNLTAAAQLLTSYAGAFNITTTKTGSSAFVTDVPASVRSWLGGKKGSLLDLYGGEWKWDGYTCTLSTARGADRGVTIRYGKNLISLTQEEECSNVYTHVRPFWTDMDGNVVTGGLISTGITLDNDRIYFVDCSGQFDDTPTATQLNTYAQDYIADNNLTVPHVNLTLDFVQLKGLSERVDLCDTVSIQFETLGVSAQAKCIKTVWDVLKDRYESASFGDSTASIADTIGGIPAQTDAKIAQSASALEAAIGNATAMITGNAGGYVVLHDTDSDGKPDEILIMNTPSITTATKVWRWNKNGLGYSSTGYSGTYGTAITADGQIVANYITSGTLDASKITVTNIDASNITSGELSADLIGSGNINITKKKQTSTADGNFIIKYETSAGGYLVHAYPVWLRLGYYDPSSPSNISNLFDATITRDLTAGYDYCDFRLRRRNTNTGVTGYTIALNSSTGAITCVSLTQTSDRNAKEQIEDLDPDESLDFILNLQPKRFKFKEIDGIHHGFIAQDVEQIVDDWDIVSENKNNRKSLAYTEIIADLVATVQQLNKRVTELETMLKERDKT